MYTTGLGLLIWSFSLQKAAALSCDTDPNLLLRASGSQKLVGPFSDQNALANQSHKGYDQWTWTVAAQSESNTTPNSTIQQGLWLEDISPPIDLSSPNLGYYGCGLVVHGLKQSAIKAGQSDPGDCSKALTQKCSEALSKASSDYANQPPRSDVKPSGKLCDGFNSQSSLIKDACQDDLESYAWVESFRTFSRGVIINMSTNAAL